MAKRQMRPGLKFLLILVVFGALFFLFLQFKDYVLPAGKSGSTAGATRLRGNVKAINVCVVTWGGYAGGQYFNGGFNASKESRYYKEYGLLVNFKVMDDFQASREAWKSGQVDLLWITADAFPTEADALKMYDPKIVFQADWSRGGDVIVAARGINRFEDLRGKKIAVAFGTPSHTFLLWNLKAANMTYRDITVVEVASAIDAATQFKAGNVNAAVVWSPDDEDCVTKVPGAHVLISTRQASNIIADVFYAKAEFIASHKAELKALVEGWLRGAAEINTNPLAKEEAVRILSAGLGQPEDFMRKAINNVRLCTYGDNANFFNLQGTFRGVTGEELYTKTGALYREIGLVTNLPAWRTITDVSIIQSINLSGTEHAAEPAPTFTKPTAAMANTPALSTKMVTINFATGSAILDENSKTIIDLQLADIAKYYRDLRVRIEGNTDNTGSYETNVRLSQRRAEAVANYLVSQYGFSQNRFVIKGNGPDKPVADNGTDEGRAKNRRTDFELIPE